MVQSFGVLLLCIVSVQVSAEQEDSGDTVTAIRNTLEKVEDLRYQGAYQEGIELARKAISEAAYGNEVALEVEAVYQLSLLYYYQQDYPQARAEMQIGLARARVHELEVLEADFLAALGVLEWKQGNLHLALPKLEEAMGINEKRGNFVSMASISNNIGIIHYILQNYTDAEFYYREALKFLQENDNKRLRSSLYINLSEVLIPLNSLEESETYLAQALELEKEFKDPQSLGYIYVNMGELASRKGQSDAAIEHFQEALQLQQQIGDKWAIAETHLRMSREYFKNNQLSVSLEHAQAGYNLAQELNTLSQLRDFSSHFIALYEAMGEPGHIQFFTDQVEWLEQRVSLQQAVKESVQNDNKPAPIDSKNENQMLPVHMIIITLLAAMILILVLENTRLRLRVKTF